MIAHTGAVGIDVRPWLTALALLLLTALLSSATSAQSRAMAIVPSKAAGPHMALVIGNSAYADAPLVNPANDAKAIASAIKDGGFEVTTLSDTGLAQLKDAVRDFAAAVDRDGTVALLYFSGYGVQIKGRSYLLPVDIRATREFEVADRALALDYLIDALDATKAKAIVIIVDASRPHPFGQRFKAPVDGLAPVTAPPRTVVMFPAAPGKVTVDDESGASAFATLLAAKLQQPDGPVEGLLQRVKEAVARDSTGEQEPYITGTLGNADFSLIRRRPEAATAAAKPAASGPSRSGDADEGAFELEFWRSIKDSTDAADFQAYLEQYPSGRFASLANNRLAKLLEGIDTTRTTPLTTSPAPPAQAVTPATPAATPMPKAATSAAPQPAMSFGSLKQRADQGDVAAQVELGQRYENGDGVDKNLAEAFRYYLLAAERGNPHAQNNVGYAYAYGQGVELSLESAASWYRKSAEQGLASAQFNLGWAYYRGRGVKANSREALRWLSRAAEQNEPMALGILGDFYREGNAVSRDTTKAAELYRQAAQLGFSKAQYDLGMAYRDGEGVTKDLAEALKWIEKAANGGHRPAIAEMVDIYDKGLLGVARNSAKAREWEARPH